MTSRLKPIQLLWFIGLSNVAVTAAVIVMVVQSWHLTAGHRLPAGIRTPCITVMAVFLAAGFLGEWLLQRGVRSGIWPNVFLDSARRLVQHPVVKVLFGAICISAIVSLIASPIHTLYTFGLLMCLPYSLSRVSTTHKVKEAEFTSSELSGSALYPAKRLQSEHWGN